MNNNLNRFDMSRTGLKKRRRNGLRGALLAEMVGGNHWEGRLSSSALATATASFALALTGRSVSRGAVAKGLRWLAENANDDGGWGDSPESPSNPAATLLSWCALSFASERLEFCRWEAVERGEVWVREWLGVPSGVEISGSELASSVLDIYGSDRTFSVPILTMCAIAGKLGDAEKAWRSIPRLPFELALAPPRLLSWLGLPVVSYAMPALIAMGIIGHERNPTPWPCLRLLRGLSVEPALRELSVIQPENGGFLEAAPLTSFVLMSLAAAGRAESSVAVNCAEYLLSGQRSDGSWPIDANLAVWLTSLAVSALPSDAIPAETRREIRGWLLERQFKKRHRFTNAAPGGWGWTHLPGAVPDADDTAAAVVALGKLNDGGSETLEAAEAGIAWLLNLQNSDGGFPTFCRGWGWLPFDRSTPEITAHALRAFAVWSGKAHEPLRGRMEASAGKAVSYLRRSRRSDGAWDPLWFGSQLSKNRRNPVFGTAKVAIGLSAALEVFDGAGEFSAVLADALNYLRGSRNEDGGWGAEKGLRSTIEETAMAVSALARSDGGGEFVDSGLRWLEESLSGTGSADEIKAAPIGLYFASLWYSEKLYPLIFAVEAEASAER